MSVQKYIFFNITAHKKIFFQKKCTYQKKVYFCRRIDDMEMSYGVMVALQILVLPV